MKQLIAVMALGGVLACGQAGAFWGWSDSDHESSSGRYDGRSDVKGDADAEGAAEFTFNFTGKAKAKGDFKGDADTDTDWRGYSYDAPYYYGAPAYYGYGPYGTPYAPGPQVTVPPQQ